ncbi:MAG: hypothetical protein JHC31_07790 [Sulfurihydrogenibium sp.]|nr:hypothetical protein [Sulfurihydrogenibium sp.]
MIIGKGAEDVDYNRPAIVFGEDLIKRIKNAVGALYWRKGRPQLIFIKSRLDRFRIQLPSEYRRYLVDESVLSKVIDSFSIRDMYLAWER